MTALKHILTEYQAGLLQMLRRSWQCADMDSDNVVLDDEFIINQTNGPENELYFYHTDHLGSSSWITDASGAANQYLAYLPFGIPIAIGNIDQRTNGHDIRFKFTGKERDAETGYDYFGARYYSSELSVWLSVDAYSSYYPHISPYLYVAGNPINLIDFNGNFIVDEAFKKKDPNFYSYLTNQLIVDVQNSVELKKQLMELGEFSTWEELKKVLTTGSGPNLGSALHPGSKADGGRGMLASSVFAGGFTYLEGDKKGDIELSSVLLDYFEKAFSSDNITDRKYALMYVYVTLLHETVHYGDITHGENRNGKIIPETNCHGEPESATSEIGDIFEMRVWGYNIGSNNAKDSKDLLLQYKYSTQRVFNLFNVAPSGSQFSQKDLPTTSKRKHPPMYDPH